MHKAPAVVTEEKCEAAREEERANRMAGAAEVAVRDEAAGTEKGCEGARGKERGRAGVADDCEAAMQEECAKAWFVQLAGLVVHESTAVTAKPVKREVGLAREDECVRVLAAAGLTEREAACAREEERLKVLAAELASREAVIMAAAAGLTAVPGILDREAAVGGREAVVGGREASVAGREVAVAVREVAVGEGQRELDRQLSAAGMLVELHNLP